MVVVVLLGVVVVVEVTGANEVTCTWTHVCIFESSFCCCAWSPFFAPVKANYHFHKGHRQHVRKVSFQSSICMATSTVCWFLYVGQVYVRIRISDISVGKPIPIHVNWYICKLGNVATDKKGVTLENLQFYGNPASRENVTRTCHAISDWFVLICPPHSGTSSPVSLTQLNEECFDRSVIVLQCKATGAGITGLQWVDPHGNVIVEDTRHAFSSVSTSVGTVQQKMSIVNTKVGGSKKLDRPCVCMSMFVNVFLYAVCLFVCKFSGMCVLIQNIGFKRRFLCVTAHRWQTVDCTPAVLCSMGKLSATHHTTSV